MIHFVFSESNLSYLYLTTDNTVEDIENIEKLKASLNLVDPNCYRKNYKGEPKVVKFLFDFTQRNGNVVYYTYIGLWQEVYKFFRDNNIPFDGLTDKYFKRKLQHSFEEFKQIVDGWGLLYKPRPYQYECAYKILQWNTSISSLATRAGKTLLAYIVFRYAKEYLGARNILMIVPSTDLVRQGFKDFNDYKEFFETECIWAGGKEVATSNLTIGTFQSLIKYLDRTDKKYNPRFYDKFDIVFVDEVHRATADQIRTIITQPFMKKLKISFGLTGTLPEENTIERYTVAMELGAKIQTIRPRDLMDDGYISDIHIHQKFLHYKDIDYLRELYIRAAEYRICEYELDENGDKMLLDNPEFLFQYKKSQLPEGIMEVRNELYDTDKKQYVKYLTKVITESERTNNLSVETTMVPLLPNRTAYIIRLLKECPRNTLVLGTHVEYVKHLYNAISEAFPDKIVRMIIGKVSSKKRAQVNDLLKENDNCILVANYATCSTGLTFGGLCYGIFTESYESNVINMQSLGRGLGLVEGKDKYVVYDLIDVLPSYKIHHQGKAKQAIYEREEYPYDVEQVNI